MPLAAQTATILSSAGLRRLPANPYGALESLFAIDALLPSAAAEEAGGLPQRAATADTKRLRVFHFNDLHNYLTTPHAVRGDTHAFGQMVRMVRAARAAAGANEIVLFTSSGDDQTGNVLDELLGFSPAEMIVHPAYHAFSVAGVDAMALGNHEFDRGTDMLRLALTRNPAVPALSANIHGAPALPPGAHHHAAVVGVAKGLRIGLVGLTTAEDTRTNTPENPGLVVSSPLETLRRVLPPLAATSDVIIVLSHLGYKPGEGDLGIAQLAADLTTKPVLVLGGHSHTALNASALDPLNLLDGRVAVAQAGAHGSHLGEITLDLSPAGAASALSARLITLKRADRRVPATDARAADLQQPADVDDGFQSLVMAPILARLDRRLGDVIGMVDAGPEVTTEATLAARYVGETAIGNLMNDLMVARSVATFPDGPVDIAVFNATGLVAGVPPRGPITFSDWFAVMPFTDSVQIFTLSAAEIQAILDNNAKRIVRPEELRAPTPPDLKGYVSRGFLHFSRALRYTIALGGNAREARAADATFDGRPLASFADRKFRVLFGSYVGNGAFAEAWNGREIAGLGITGFDLTALPKRDTGFVYRNEVVAQIRARETLTPADGARLDQRLTVI